MSRTPKLSELHCNFNQLAVLDVRPLENLEELWFDYDRTGLDSSTCNRSSEAATRNCSLKTGTRIEIEVTSSPARAPGHR